MLDIKQKLRAGAAGFLDLLLPQECLGCGASQTWLCPGCQRKILINQSHSCYICRRPSLQGETHKECRENDSLNGLLAACRHTQLIKDLIHTFKYEHVVDLAPLLAGYLIRKIELSPVLHSIMLNPKTALIPVPLHRTKEWERGYNQAQLLGQEIAKSFPVKLLNDSVKRLIKTKTQTELPREKRMSNIDNAFKVIEPDAIKDRTVILIDDVCTTGATLTELAKVCRQAGTKEVWAVVITRD